MQPLHNPPFYSSTVLGMYSYCIPYLYVIYLFSLNGGLVVWLPDEILPGWEGGHSQPRQGQQAQHHQQQHSYTTGPQQLLHTSNGQLSHSITTVNSWRSLHELRQQHQSLHSSHKAQQLPWLALATTTVYLQTAQVPQQVLHSITTAGNSLFIAALSPFCSFFTSVTSLTTASSQQSTYCNSSIVIAGRRVTTDNGILKLPASNLTI